MDAKTCTADGGAGEYFVSCSKGKNEVFEIVAIYCTSNEEKQVTPAFPKLEQHARRGPGEIVR